ncbi:phage GP46 family protein [Sodalis ligni]|uniref:phage GP46 family protein n=1 Tax=Sodalis ligni TaxID=2697027 RepID=UPI00193FFFA8|nr:phage GP46 family protein [Sodalis ligni]QWA09786.1 phage GP46 family protein [Sodalis ligni]
MTDITTIWNGEQSVGDWQIGQGDLLSGSDLETAILISLFTDRLARADDDYDGDDRRGWWGDSGADYPIGSRLWLLHRQKLTPATATRAETYATEALQWLVDDGVVSTVTITTQIVYPSRLYMQIVFLKPDNASSSFKYSWVWEK